MATNIKNNLSTAFTNGECATSLDLLGDLRKKYPHQPTFLQAVEEMALSLQSLFTDPEEGEFYQRAFLAMTEPERTISFRIPWEDDAGVMHFNRGWRVEFSRYVYVSVLQ
jgi:glutamate dehydrogenase (NADP+)